MPLSPESLELFVRVAGLGALGRAGREFQLSPTATTQRIKALERELGVTLLNRTTRAVSLTPDGEVFLVHARRILGTIEDARSDLACSAENVRGELRVTASASFGRRHLVPYVAAFLREYPNVHVRLDLSDGVVDIVEQGYDLALRVGTLASSSLVARRLADNPRLLVASPGYLATCGTPQQPQDLESHNCLLLGEARQWQLRGPGGELHEVRVHGSLACNYGEAITEAVLADAGIALKSRWDVQHLLDDASLVAVLPEYTPVPEWGLWAVRPPGAGTPARVRTFVDFMEAGLREAAARDGAG